MHYFSFLYLFFKSLFYMSTKENQETEKNTASNLSAKTLLVGSAGAFVGGVFGAIWYTKRKQAKQSVEELLQQQRPVETINKNIQQQQTICHNLPNEYKPPTMTAAEYELSKKHARFFAFKTLGYGTLLAFSGAGVLAAIVGYWLDVRNFQEFSDKLHVIIPERTSRLRRYLGGKDFKMTDAEEQELEDILEEITTDE
ncbi:unnamed protein product [Cunninghamella blakesleeana]